MSQGNVPQTSTALIPYPMSAWDQVLAKNGEGPKPAKTGSVQECPLKKPWELSVRLESADRGHWPKDGVHPQVTFDHAPTEIHVVRMTADELEDITIDGHGPDRGVGTLEVAGWEVAVAPREVTLPKDSGATLVFTLRERWVGLRVRHHDRDALVAGVRARLSLPGSQEAVEKPTEGTLRVGGLSKLGPSALLGLTVEQGIWEVVE